MTARKIPDTARDRCGATQATFGNFAADLLVPSGTPLPVLACQSADCTTGKCAGGGGTVRPPCTTMGGASTSAGDRGRLDAALDRAALAAAVGCAATNVRPPSSFVLVLADAYSQHGKTKCPDGAISPW